MTSCTANKYLKRCVNWHTARCMTRKRATRAGHPSQENNTKSFRQNPKPYLGELFFRHIKRETLNMSLSMMASNEAFEVCRVLKAGELIGWNHVRTNVTSLQAHLLALAIIINSFFHFKGTLTAADFQKKITSLPKANTLQQSHLRKQQVSLSSRNHHQHSTSIFAPRSHTFPRNTKTTSILRAAASKSHLLLPLLRVSSCAS